jgi:hypothetical protein
VGTPDWVKPVLAIYSVQITRSTDSGAGERVACIALKALSLVTAFTSWGKCFIASNATF